MKNRLKAILSALWTAMVLFFAVVYFFKRWPDVLGLLDQLDALFLCGAFSLLLISKMLLPLFMKCALDMVRLSMTAINCFYIYHTSQLAKYLPGNIWHFVSKAGAYRVRGYSVEQIRDALLIENGLLVSGALVTGVLLTGSFGIELLQHWGGHINIMGWLGIMLLVVLAGVAAFILERKIGLVRKIRFSTKNVVAIILLQAGIWLSLGGMLFILMNPYLKTEPRMVIYLYSTGVFALGYAIGFVTPFAPAGIGIREGILVLGLAPYIESGDTVILISTVSRLLYVAVEIILALLCKIGKIKASVPCCK